MGLLKVECHLQVMEHLQVTVHLQVMHLLQEFLVTLLKEWHLTVLLQWELLQWECHLWVPLRCLIRNHMVWLHQACLPQ